MAYPVHFKGANLVLQAPEGRDDVSDLHVMRNRGMVVSCWELSDAELEEIRLTARIFLSVMGHTMAPAFIGTGEVMRDFTAEYGILPKQGRYLDE